MGISATSGSLGAAMAGVRQELLAATVSRALEDAGVPDENLARGLEALSSAARATTEAGLAAARAEMTGTLIDVVA